MQAQSWWPSLHHRPPPATIVNPTSGHMAGDTELRIHGSGFTGETQVRTGTVMTSFTVIGDTEISATTSASSTASMVFVTVTT